MSRRETLFIMPTHTFKDGEILQFIKMYIFKPNESDSLKLQYDCRPKLETLPTFLGFTWRKKSYTRTVALSKT